MVDNWTDWWCTKRWPTCPTTVSYSSIVLSRKKQDILISKEIKRQSLCLFFNDQPDFSDNKIERKKNKKTNKYSKKNWSNRCQTRETIISTMPTGQENSFSTRNVDVLFIWLVCLFFIISKDLGRNFELLKDDGRLFPTERVLEFLSSTTSLIYRLHTQEEKGGCETERATTLFLFSYSKLYKNSTSGSKFSERTERGASKSVLS